MKVKLKTLSEFTVKLFDLIVVLSMGIVTYLALFQDNDIVKIVGVFNGIQMARLLYTRWF